MIQNAAFRRKVIYLGLIALLLIPLYVVGHPAVGDPLKQANASPGGRLAQLRAEYDLSPAELGEIDPTSESMKLATLGMRGVAATILWSKANEYKKKENWEGLVAVVNQMAKLQPNFISVWEFQSHNLSYNISVEQDDYRFRYLWVKKGIEFLIQGTHYNRGEPKLFWTVGWYTGQKFNRADESKQFRRLFKADQDFHDLQNVYVDVDGSGRGADGRPDSWLVSRLWYNRAYDLVDNQGRSLRGKSPHIFFADGPKALMNYAGAIEDEGYLDERAEYAWKRADGEWTQLGDRQVPTSNGLLIRLNDQEKLTAESERLAKELDELVPGAREAIRAEKLAQLTPRQRAALDMDMMEIQDPQDYQHKMEAQTKTQVTHLEVAERAPAAVRAKAHRLAQAVVNAATTANWIDRYRENVNFDYWRTRCRIEQLSETVAARRHIYQATQLKDKVELDAARKEYEKAWEIWAKLIEQYPDLVESLTADDLYEYVESYVQLLSQLDETLPEDFKLRPLLEKHGQMQSVAAAGGSDSAAAPDTTGKAPAAKAEEKSVSQPAAEEKEKQDKEQQEDGKKPADEEKKPADQKEADEKKADAQKKSEENKAKDESNPRTKAPDPVQPPQEAPKPQAAEESKPEEARPAEPKPDQPEGSAKSDDGK